MSLKVGEFSRLCQVPVKTLRYYDEIGLFKPSQIDRFTSYRYYSLDQLPRIHRIMALKELGLSLDQIAELVSANPTLDEIRQMFLDKQQEVQRRVDEELSQLALVRFHLRQIESEAKMPDLQIVVKKLEPFYALTFRKIFSTQKDIDAAGYAIQAAQQKGVLQPIAVPMGIAYVEEFTRHDLDYEFVLPVLSPSVDDVALETGDSLRLREIPEMEYAATYLHQGDYDGLNDAGIALQRWAVENGYRLGAQMRMLYFRGPMHRVPPDQYLTELQHHIEKTV